jgi:23S rRNA (guanosine2251-2'-O)-methyltransferase
VSPAKRSGGPGGPSSGRSGGAGRSTGGRSTGGRSSAASDGRSKAGKATSRGAGARSGGGNAPGGRSIPGSRRTPPSVGLGGDQVEGRQAVRELLHANRRQVRSLLMAEGMDAAAILDEIEALAGRRRVRVEYVSRRRIDSVARTDAPQGVVALARPVEETPLDSLCEPSRRGRVPFLLVLDGITDPHNMGALLRSAECAGVTGVVLPRHRSAHLSPTVAKVAAGAIEYLPMALVAGVPAALQRLSALGVWTVGMVGEARQSLYDLPLGDQPVALVLGSEGSGLADLTRKRCDALASIPQHGSLSSLNVSTAGAIACFDVARRRASGTPER